MKYRTVTLTVSLYTCYSDRVLKADIRRLYGPAGARLRGVKVKR